MDSALCGTAAFTDGECPPSQTTAWGIGGIELGCFFKTRTASFQSSMWKKIMIAPDGNILDLRTR
jgi:hypothetical protein